MHIVMCLLFAFLQSSVIFSLLGPNIIQIFVLRMFIYFEHLCLELISNTDEFKLYGFHPVVYTYQIFYYLSRLYTTYSNSCKLL